MGSMLICRLGREGGGISFCGQRVDGMCKYGVVGAQIS